MAFATHCLAALIALLLISAIEAQTKLAGYTPDSNVDQHAFIDLDQKDMEEFTNDFDFEKAREIYSEGKHSQKSSGKRTLQGFSTSADEKMKNEPYFELFKKFWGTDTYADDFIIEALNSAGDFSGKRDIFRAECANKGSQYQATWMYVIHEMEDAINDCLKGDLDDNDNGVKAWDEAWAFWVGSTIDQEGTNTEEGFLGWSLAEKRAVNYETKDGDNAKVNVEMLRLFKTGKEQLEKKDCDDARESKNLIARQMTIPLIQGIIRYVITTKGEMEKEGETDEEKDALDKAHGEGWAFSAAALPLISHCSTDVADRLKKNFFPTAKPPMEDSIEVVMKDLQSVYNCMGFKCADVGKDDPKEGECSDSGDDFKAIPGSDKSASGESGNGGLSGGAIAAIVIVILVILVVIGFFVLRRGKKKAERLPTAGGMLAEEEVTA